MPTGLKFKDSTAKYGGLNIQPMKSQLQSAADPTIYNPAQFGIALPSHMSQLASAVGQLQFDSLKSQKSKIVAAKGISSLRPEILLASRFEPAYQGEIGRDVSDTGLMLETQMSARNARVDNINKFVDSLMHDSLIAAQLAKLQAEYTSQMERARDDTKFIIDTHTIIDTMLRALNIYGEHRRLRKLAVQSTGDNSILDIRQIFVDHLGFDEDGFKNFTNTKIFGQLAFDLANAVRRYTPGLFDIIDADRPTDVDPIKYDKTVTLSNGKFSFDIASFGHNLRSLNAFNGIFFDKFINSLPETRLDRMKLISVTMSRLFGISTALGMTKVQVDLNNLRVNDNGDDQIISMIGTPGQTIVDESEGENSLISLTRIVDTNTDEVALPFEKRQIIDKNNNDYVPGSDYFFDNIITDDDKFDITRVANFNQTLEHRINLTMNVVEAATRTDTQYAKTLFGSKNNTLSAETIFQSAHNTVADILMMANGNDFATKNFIFILSIITLSQTDQKLRHLLFQLFAITVIFNDLKQVDPVTIGVMQHATQNELKTYGNLPALFDYVTNVPVATIVGTPVGGNPLLPDGEQAIAQEINVGRLPITATHAVGTAYKHVQRLVLDRTFALLGSHASQGSIGSKNVVQVANIGGTSGTNIQIEKPTSDQTFDEDFRSVMFSIARFIDDIEDTASRGEGSVNRHLIDDDSGRTKYLSISSSMRMLFAFELIMSMLGSYDFSRFNNVSANESVANVTYSKTRIKSFAKAATVTSVSTDATPSSQYQQSFAVLAINSASKNLGQFSSGVSTGHVDDQLVDEFKSELGNIKESLRLDLSVIKSITQNFRKIASHFDHAVDKAQAYFNDPVVKRYIAQLMPQEQIDIRRGTLDANTLEKRILTTSNEKKARKALLSKEQAALAFVRLRDIAEYNAKFSPLSYQATTVNSNPTQGDQGNNQPRDVFVDDTRVPAGVQDALWCMLSEPEFRGADGNVTKILTVGIPAGFNDKLMQSDRVYEDETQHAHTNKQLDMITINVHMKNVIEDDIVFKPCKFVFELSRFVSQFSFENINNTEIRSQIKLDALIREHVRTLDFSSLSETNTRGQLGSDFIDDVRYEFLSRKRRKELLRNHVVSFLLSVYMKMLTGIDAREDSFLFEPTAALNHTSRNTSLIFQAIASRIVELSDSDLTLGQLRAKFPEFDELLTSIEAGEFSPGVLEQQQIFDRLQMGKTNVLVSQELSDLAKLSGSRSMLTSGEKLRHTITSPKLFERVFNVAVDPFAFEIDVDKTQSTVAGRAAFNRLIRQKRLSVKSDRETGKTSAYLKRITKNMDISIDQYFVVIERYDATQKKLKNSINSVITKSGGVKQKSAMKQLNSIPNQAFAKQLLSGIK